MGRHTMNNRRQHLETLAAALTAAVLGVAVVPVARAAEDEKKDAKAANPCAAGGRRRDMGSPCSGGDTRAQDKNPCAGGRGRAGNPCSGNPCAGSSGRRRRGGDNNPCAGKSR